MDRARTWDDYPAIMTTVDVAELFDLHPNTLTKRVRAGEIPARKLPGGRGWRFDRDELRAWWESLQADQARDNMPSEST